ncbi:MAG TPA: acylneuraminate cytidylyltransferase family protein [Thermodesulfobacteriota bacterium]|nr:acylneuraminate cytidylyltransferase family protein [Thermodesulfobacteriota bacterium]
MEVLGIIPARQGSKGIKYKNIIPLLGKPLISYTIMAAKKSKMISRLIVSSDDPKILAIAESEGVKTPFLRPESLATGETPSADVAIHAFQKVQSIEGKKYDAIILLQPTSPLRTTYDIDNAINLLEEKDADSVISVMKLEKCHPFKLLRVENEKLKPLYPEKWKGSIRRQEMPPIYITNGAIYCIKSHLLIKNRTFWSDNNIPYIMPPERSIDIDSVIDLKLAEILLKERIENE